MSDDFFSPNPLRGALSAYLEKTSLTEFVREFYEKFAHPALRERFRETGVTMPEHPGLLCSIVAAPDDDYPRLVYADYLEERAESGGALCESDRARAELIRLQIRVARGPDCPVCRKTGIYRGTHRRYCELMGIDPANTDVTDHERPVEYECRLCDYKDAANRVRWLLKTKYPVPSFKKTRLKIAGEELWKPHAFIGSREARYVRGFVGVVAIPHSSFLLCAKDLVACAPLEQIVLCDRVLNRDVVPFGRVGYFWIPDGINPPAETAGVVVTKSLFELAVTLRDKDFPDGVLDCYKWLSWAALYYARAKAKLPAWLPRPADAPLYPALKRGMPSHYFDPTGVVLPLTPAALAIDPWIEQQYRDRVKPYVDYDGFAAYYQEDGFDDPSPVRSSTVSPLAPPF